MGCMWSIITVGCEDCEEKPDKYEKCIGRRKTVCIFGLVKGKRDIIEGYNGGLLKWPDAQHLTTTTHNSNNNDSFKLNKIKANRIYL